MTELAGKAGLAVALALFASVPAFGGEGKWNYSAGGGTVAGEWTLVASPSIVAGNAAGWTCTADSSYAIRLRARNGALALRIVPKGLIIDIR